MECRVAVAPIGFLLVNLAVLSDARSAFGQSCMLQGPRYALVSEVVTWSMRSESGLTCTRGLRLNNALVENVQVLSEPQSGQLAIHGPGISYKSRSGFAGKDSFDLQISGVLDRHHGSSTIHVDVLVSAAPQKAPPAAGSAPPPPTAAGPEVPVLFAPPSGGLPGCPIRDWSKGAPPPMRPPFDRSKLYCPPPPFKPPGPPIGCACPP